MTRRSSSALGIQPVAASVKQRWFGKGGESPDHKALKEHVRDHPGIVGATSSWKCFVQYPLPSLDEIDVLFKSADAWVAAEVKSAISEARLALRLSFMVFSRVFEGNNLVPIAFPEKRTPVKACLTEVVLVFILYEKREARELMAVLPGK
jgi:hypothetical protein